MQQLTLICNSEKHVTCLSKPAACLYHLDIHQKGIFQILLLLNIAC